MASLLAPRQLGFGISDIIEAAVHATRRYVEHMKPGHVLVKVDFTNAFNTIRRDYILEEIANHLPELLPFVSSTMDNSSDFQLENIYCSHKKALSRVTLWVHYTFVSFSKTYCSHSRVN